MGTPIICGRGKHLPVNTSVLRTRKSAPSSQLSSPSSYRIPPLLPCLGAEHFLSTGGCPIQSFFRALLRTTSFEPVVSKCSYGQHLLSLDFSKAAGV